MSISFERFVALTAALATASSVMAGCGDDDGTTNPGAGGTGGSAGKGGKAGRAGSGGTSAGAGSGGKGGTAGKGAGGSSATGGFAGAGEGGEGAAAAGQAGMAAGSGGTSQGGSGGNEPTGGTSGESGTGGTLGGSGEAGQGGAGGVPPDEPCFGDEGLGYCFGGPDGDIPSDECLSGPNPAFRSCVYSESLLRAGVVDGHAACLVPITDACTVRAAIATDECERETLRRACPTPAADDACANGLNTFPSPVVACSDGTLTLTSCAKMLSAVAPGALEDIVRCSDPAGEYGSVFSGTCAERLQQCIFPHAPLYP